MNNVHDISSILFWCSVVLWWVSTYVQAPMQIEFADGKEKQSIKRNSTEIIIVTLQIIRGAFAHLVLTYITYILHTVHTWIIFMIPKRDSLWRYQGEEIIRKIDNAQKCGLSHWWRKSRRSMIRINQQIYVTTSTGWWAGIRLQSEQIRITCLFWS